MSYDIGAANQRQSDFLWGYNDALENRNPRGKTKAYRDGWVAGMSERGLVKRAPGPEAQNGGSTRPG